MKENNKFSLSAFFCSLGSKSKIFMLFLLGAPFLLVQIFTLKVCANSAVVPVVPEGLTTSGLGSSGVVPGDPSLIYYTLLIALGMKADEVYQINKADIIDSVTEALNEYDSVNDPSLGDDLETYLEWYDNAKSQNGYINELSIPRELWNRLNKATSSGLNLRIQSNTPSLTPLQDYFDSEGFSNYTLNSTHVSNMFGQGNIYFFTSLKSGSTQFYYAFSNVDSYSIDGRSLNLNFKDTPSYGIFMRKNEFGIQIDYVGNLVTINSLTQSYNSSIYEWTFAGTASGSILNKSVGVARPFISSKANGTYDVVSKSATFDDQGKIGGDVTISVLSYEEIATLASDDPDTTTDIPPVLPRMRVVPIDIDDPDAIPDAPGIPGETPEEIAEELADTVDPSPVDPIVIEPFLHIDQWDPYIPDPTPEPPLVGLSAVMNWLAEQMQITMFLTQFSNCWLVLSTLVVAACMIGLVRIWR